MAISAEGQNLISSALSLPLEERIEVAEQLWESVHEEWSWDKADPEWRRAWETEIQRRIEDVRTGKTQLLDGEMVMNELRERLSK